MKGKVTGGVKSENGREEGKRTGRGGGEGGTLSSCREFHRRSTALKKNEEKKLGGELTSTSRKVVGWFRRDGKGLKPSGETEPGVTLEGMEEVELNKLAKD